MIDLENGKNSIVGMGGYSAANQRTGEPAHKPVIIPVEGEQIITKFPRDFLQFSAAPSTRIGLKRRTIEARRIPSALRFVG